MLPLTTVTVVIASIGRPSLERTLHSIAAQKLPPSTILDVVIADDSEDGAAQRIAQNGFSHLPVNVVRVGRGNIAAARNAALAASTGAYVAFIDDDEWAEPDWLEALLVISDRYRADAVFGPVEAVYPDGVPSWKRRIGVYQKRPGREGQHVKTGATSNALLRRAAALNVRFREEFGETGGEDTDFFARLGRAGAVLVASDQGLVHENVPSERMRLDHLCRRYTRGGHTYARIELEGASHARRTAFYAAAALKAVVSVVTATACAPVRRDIACSFALKAALNTGKLIYGAGWPSPRPY